MPRSVLPPLVVLMAALPVSTAAAWAETKTSANTANAAVAELQAFLDQDPADRGALGEQKFAVVSLTREAADHAAKLLVQEHQKRIRRERADEMKAKVLRIGNLEMPFAYKIFGDKPENGRSLYISMHGGGGAPKRVNDSQWENQKRLYQPKEGVYLAPRAPTDTWNLWHQGHIDAFFDRLIENLIVFEDVDPNRVYLMGYSAGGDGVYQLAPRFADRLAAASMMAGHPNETSPIGLRNLPFSLHVGGKDAAYNRNKIGRQWAEKLKSLQEADPKGYIHWAKIYENKGHWMDREDAAALPWMAKYVRNRTPERIVWKQDDVTHTRFYWLGVPKTNVRGRAEVIVNRDGQTFTIEKSDVPSLILRLNDELIDLDKPIMVIESGERKFQGTVNRTIGALAASLEERGDPSTLYAATLTVTLKKEE